MKRPRTIARACGVGLLICACVAAVRPALARRQEPGLRLDTTDSTLVQVDVMVRDNADHFVSGLTASDLDLYEDGKRQTILQCYLVAMEPTTGETFVVDDGEVHPLGPQSHRLFVLMFDERDLEPNALSRIKDGAQSFLNTNFHTGDFGGVVVNGRLYEGKLTQSKATLAAAIRSVKPAFDSRDARLRTFREFPRIAGEAEATRLATGDRMLLQQVAEQDCRIDAFQCADAGGQEAVQGALQRKAILYLGQAREATRGTLESIQRVVGPLLAVPGRKTVVFFTDGLFSTESRAELQQITGLAARADTAIYSVSGNGVSGALQVADVTSPSAAFASARDLNDDARYVLADGTGALVLRQANDVARALDQISADTSTYYVLSYRPTNPVMDGTYRRITVKAKASGLHIRTRAGYLAVPSPQTGMR